MTDNNGSTFRTSEMGSQNLLNSQLTFQEENNIFDSGNEGSIEGGEMGDQYDEWNEGNRQGKDEEGGEEIGKQNVSRSDNMNVKSTTFLKQHPPSASSVLHDNL